jgi:hypothetical protein
MFHGIGKQPRMNVTDYLRIHPGQIHGLIGRKSRAPLKCAKSTQNLPCFGFRIQYLESGCLVAGARVRRLGFRVWGSGCRCGSKDLSFRVKNSRFEANGLVYRDLGFRS